MSITLKINGESREINADADTPLLWVVRDELNLTGTKFGCGVASCGSCTVHIDGKPQRSCVLPISAVGDGEVTTIDAIDTPQSKAVQAAWQELDAAMKISILIWPVMPVAVPPIIASGRLSIAHLTSWRGNHGYIKYCFNESTRFFKK